MIHKLIQIFLLFFVFSCSHQSLEQREYQVGAYLWQQNSGEYQALCYQAYNIARLKLDRDLENKHNKKRAVIFDIDETVFDNSFGGAEEIVKNIPWNPESFDKWVTRKKSHAIPGAKEFIDYAISKRVEVIYVTNRTADQIDDTLENFKSLGIPAKKENIYTMDKDWSKESRRREISKKYEIVLLFGDNLHDFAKDWDEQTSVARKAIVDKRSRDFGDKFIIFPNPLYGDWENALPKKTNRRENLIINP
jgi:5'-nucleotidase (lipoprotein e(P4) family)